MRSCTQDVSAVPTSVYVFVFECCRVCWGCFWSPLSTLWGVYHLTQYLLLFVFPSELIYLVYLNLSFTPTSLTVGPSRECSLWWRISVHRKPPGATPSSRENRGYRRLTAPILPVSRLIISCHICTITHTGLFGRRIQAHSPVHCVTFLFPSMPYVLIRMWIAHQRYSSS